MNPFAIVILAILGSMVGLFLLVTIVAFVSGYASIRRRPMALHAKTAVAASFICSRCGATVSPRIKNCLNCGELVEIRHK